MELYHTERRVSAKCEGRHTSTSLHGLQLNCIYGQRGLYQPFTQVWTCCFGLEIKTIERAKNVLCETYRSWSVTLVLDFYGEI